MGKKAIVTGGGRGLCRSIAEALHDSGAEVILVGSSGSAVKAAEEMNEYGANVYAVTGNLGDRYRKLRPLFKQMYGPV